MAPPVEVASIGTTINEMEQLATRSIIAKTVNHQSPGISLLHNTSNNEATKLPKHVVLSILDWAIFYPWLEVHQF